MERDKVAFSQDFAKGIILHEVKVGVLINVISYNTHTKAVAYPAHCRTYPACAYYTSGLAMEIKSHKTIQAEIVLSYLYIALVYSSCYCKRKRHGVFCHGFWRIPRHSKHCYAVFIGGFYINIIIACTSHKKKLYTMFMEPSKH